MGRRIAWPIRVGGGATAEAIPGAEVLLIEGMGHNLPHGLRPRIAGQIADFVWRVERAAVSKVSRQAPQVRQVDL